MGAQSTILVGMGHASHPIFHCWAGIFRHRKRHRQLGETAGIRLPRDGRGGNRERWPSCANDACIAGRYEAPLCRRAGRAVPPAGSLACGLTPLWIRREFRVSPCPIDLDHGVSWAICAYGADLAIGGLPLGLLNHGRAATAGESAVGWQAFCAGAQTLGAAAAPARPNAVSEQALTSAPRAPRAPALTGVHHAARCCAE